MKKLWRTDEFKDLLQGFVEAHEEEWRQELLQFEQRKASLSCWNLQKIQKMYVEIINCARFSIAMVGECSQIGKMEMSGSGLR